MGSTATEKAEKGVASVSEKLRDRFRDIGVQYYYLGTLCIHFWCQRITLRSETSFTDTNTIILQHLVMRSFVSNGKRFLRISSMKQSVVDRGGI